MAVDWLKIKTEYINGYRKLTAKHGVSESALTKRAIAEGWRVAKEAHGSKIEMVNHRVGEVSSKYAYQPELFERDMQLHIEGSQRLWGLFRAWMIDNKIDPEKCRYMFVRLCEEFLS